VLIGRPRCPGLGARDRLAAALSIITTTSRGCRAQSRAGRLGRNDGAGGAAGVARGSLPAAPIWRGCCSSRPIGSRRRARPRTLVESRAETGAKSFDFPGAFTVTGGLSLLVYAIVDAVNVGWGA